MTTLYDLAIYRHRHSPQAYLKKDEQLVPAYCTPLPEKIGIAGSAPYTNPKIKDVSRTNVEKCIAEKRGVPKFTWAEANYLPQCVKDMYDPAVVSWGLNKLNQNESKKSNVQDSKEGSLSQLADLKKLVVSQQSHYLALYYLGNKYGFAVGARKFIPKGTWICSYSGEMTPIVYDKEELDDKVYSVSCRSSSLLFQEYPDLNEGNYQFNTAIMSCCTIKGLRIGNWGEFILHAAAELPADLQSLPILTSNVITGATTRDGYPEYAFSTTKDILPGQLLSHDYGAEWWKSKPQKPAYFTALGREVHVNEFLRLQSKLKDKKALMNSPKKSSIQPQTEVVYRSSTEFLVCSIRFDYLTTTELLVCSTVNRSLKKLLFNE